MRVILKKLAKNIRVIYLPLYNIVESSAIYIGIIIKIKAIPILIINYAQSIYIRLIAEAYKITPAIY